MVGFELFQLPKKQHKNLLFCGGFVLWTNQSLWKNHPMAEMAASRKSSQASAESAWPFKKNTAYSMNLTKTNDELVSCPENMANYVI